MSPPRLLIDASAGFNQGAGIGRYSRSLLRAALPTLQSSFDVRLWYASDWRHGAPFEREALDAIPASLQGRVKRSRWSRRRSAVGFLSRSQPPRLSATVRLPTMTRNN